MMKIYQEIDCSHWNWFTDFEKEDNHSAPIIKKFHQSVSVILITGKCVCVCAYQDVTSGSTYAVSVCMCRSKRYLWQFWCFMNQFRHTIER
jgi:hypothetical protein